MEMWAQTKSGMIFPGDSAPSHRQNYIVKIKFIGNLNAWDVIILQG